MDIEIRRYYQLQGKALKEAVKAKDFVTVGVILDDVERVVNQAKAGWLVMAEMTRLGYYDTPEHQEELAGRFFMYQNAVETYHRMLKWTKLGEIDLP